MSAVSSVTSTFIPQQTSNPQTTDEADTTSDTSQTGDTTTSSETSGASGTSESQDNTQNVQAANETNDTSDTSAENSANTPTAAPTSSQPAAESQVIAKADTVEVVPETDAQPADIEQDDAQALAVARELAENYRSSAARDEYLRGLVDLSNEDTSGEQMDLKVPLVDQMPDRPAPEILPTRQVA